MGIQGLIPFLEKISKPTNISEFSGGTAVIDAYCWLHKGVFSCAEKIARGEDCDMYVSYCMKFINMLLAKNVKPILVFDGQKLPAKRETEEKRRESREQNRKKAAELMRLDRGKEAQLYLRRCIDITHEMALNLIRACRARNVDCIVAPYEADAQLAFFNMQSLADVIITEDSDLLLFGAKKVLFKMDVNGNGLLIEQNKLHVAMGVREQDFSLDKFRYMCILSGCDYLASLSGIGLMKACRFVKRTMDPDIYRALTRLSLHLNMPQLCVTQEYRDRFMEAEFMFKHQPVYDPRERRLRPLIDLNPQDENYGKYKSLIGANNLNDEQLKNLAYGNLDPFKLIKMDNWSPSKTETQKHMSDKNGWRKPSVAPYPSIWKEDYEPNSWTKPKLDPPNALCPAGAKSNNKNSQSVTSLTGNQNHLPPAKKVVLPKANLSYDQIQLENTQDERVSSIEFTDDETDDEANLSRVDDENPSVDVSPFSNQTKKMHHNPFLKASLSTSTGKRNVSMLAKLQHLCRNAEENNEAEADTTSGYFGNEVALKVSPTKAIILNRQQSSPTSPIMKGRSTKTKVTLVMKDNGQSPRSPLKTLNARNDDDDYDLSAISEKYSLPLGAENCAYDSKEAKEENKEDREVRELTRKRTIPFSTRSAEKKRSATGFLEKLNAFRRTNSSSSSFSWSPIDRSTKKPSDYSPIEIGTSTAVDLDFKKPLILSQPSDEDEGFCSANSLNSDYGSPSVENSLSHSSSAKKLTPESNKTTKLSWTTCRMSGLKKSGSRQLLLDQYAFKSAAKMKR